MRPHRRLAAIAAAQLGFGFAGLVVAVRRRHAFDIPGWRGSPERVATDALWMGTAFSAPAPMLVAQAIAAAVSARRDDRRARLVLAGLGVAMMGGYPVERLIRHRLTPGGWDAFESPLLLGGLTLAVAMAAAAAAAERTAGVS